jgi:hypothetical protein
MIRVLLNGIEPVNKPIGLDQISEKWEFDSTVNIYYVEITGNLTFYGDDFQSLYELFRDNRCEFILLEIQKKSGDNGTWYNVFQGNIIVSDIDIDFDRRLAICEIVDNSFIARIYNNNDSQINLSFDRTIGYETISNPSTLINVKSTDNVEVTDVPAVSLFNALDYVVKWLTDLNVTLESDYLTTDPDASTFYICTGEALRQQQGAENILPVISFTELWNDIHRLFHLYGFFYQSGSGWVFKVEPYSYFENIQNVIEFDKIQNVIASSKRDAFKNRIVFGSKVNEKEAVIFDNPVDTNQTWYIDGFNYYMNGWWNKDEIIVPSKCTILNTLDLRTTRLISDVNSISKSFRDGSIGLDTEIMIVQPSSQWKHIPLSPFEIPSSLPPYPLRGYFNEPIMNANVLKRWLDEICLQGNIDLFRKCELTANNTSDVLDISSGFTDTYVPCLGYGTAGYFFEKNDGRPDLFDFEYYYIIENTTGSPINVIIQGIGYPSDTTFNNYPVYYNVNRYFTPPSAGWTAAIPVTIADGLSNSVNQTISAGATVIYHGFIYDALLYKDDSFMTMNAILNGCTLKAGSYIQIRPKINKVLDINIGCNSYNTEINADGYILDEDIFQYRNQSISNILIPNSFKNVTGKVVSLERNILRGDTSINLKTKTI